MDDTFNIYIDQLRYGQERKIKESLSPDFLEVNEKDLCFKKNIEVDGVAYLAQQELIIHWNVETEALISCSICNDNVPIDINIRNFYHSEPISNIKSGIFNFKNLLRETILLEVPPFAECKEGNCPSRKEIAKYLKKPAERPEEDEGYHPFADFDLK